MSDLRPEIRKVTAATAVLAFLTLTPAFPQTQSQLHKKYSFEFTRIVDTTKEFTSFGSFPAMNNHGDVAFTAVRYGSAGVFRVREEQEKVTTIASPASGLVTFGDQVAINANGVVAFAATTTTKSLAIFKSDGISSTLIA